MHVGVGEVAERLGVSQRRVLQLIDADRIPARLVSGRWIVDESAVPRSARIGRPMSARVAWAMVELMSGGVPTELGQSEASRLRRKYARLRSAQDPARVLRSWLPHRARRVALSVASEDVAGMLGDPRLVPSGVSDVRSNLSSTGEVEGYVSEHHMRRLITEFLLSEIGRPNVWLHVIDRQVECPAPLGLVIADLADHDGPREDSQVARLLAGDL